MSYILQESTRAGKKWMVTTPSGKQVHFGAAGMSDFNKHKNEARKQNYIKRHAGNMPKGITSRREDWTKTGLDTAGFWSRWLTWNLPKLDKSIKDIEQRFNIKIVKKNNRSPSPRTPRQKSMKRYRKSPYRRRKISPTRRYRDSSVRA